MSVIGCLPRAVLGLPLTLLGSHTAVAQIDPQVEDARAELTPQVEERDNPRSDGVYGRLEGDLDLDLKVGAEYQHALAPAAALSIWYFWTVGVNASHAFDTADRADVVERTTVSLELRPLFLTRWKMDLEQGPALMDLVLDSFALGVGAQLPHETAVPGGPQLSLSLGVPLLAQASGPWLEVSGLYRFPGRTENGAALMAWLSWHFLWNSGLHHDSTAKMPTD